MNYSLFNIEPFQLLDGYIEKFTNSLNMYPETYTEEEDDFQVISKNITEGYTLAEYSSLNTELNKKKYELIDNSGNLLYKKNVNFKETIPDLKDAILEDSVNIMNYNNNIYSISGIAIAFLIIGIFVFSKKSV